jgi:hypothetical protein
MTAFHFALHDLPPEARALREEVREFLRQELRDRSPLDRAPSWGGFDREFFASSPSRSGPGAGSA